MGEGAILFPLAAKDGREQHAFDLYRVCGVEGSRRPSGNKRRGRGKRKFGEIIEPFSTTYTFSPLAGCSFLGC